MNATGKWSAYESVGFRGEWGVQSDDPSLIAAGDEIIVYPSLCEDHARLISAAPDLFEALAGLLECCEKHPAFQKVENVITRGRVTMARAALSKAGG